MIDALPKPVAYLWTIKGENAPCAAALVQGNPFRHDDQPLFTAEQVAELMERAASVEKRYGEYEGQSEPDLTASFRAAYCKPTDSAAKR